MSGQRSPTTGRHYPLAQVCTVYRVPRSTAYATARRAATPGGSAEAKRGPKTTVSDETLSRRPVPCSEPRRSRRGAPEGARSTADARPSGGAQSGVALDAPPRPPRPAAGRPSSRGPRARRDDHDDAAQRPVGHRRHPVLHGPGGLVLVVRRHRPRERRHRRVARGDGR